MLLNPGFNLTLRPMKYPDFYNQYLSALKNTWNVDEVDFKSDINDLKKATPAERHLISRLVAFFATGDSIVGNNLVLNLYKHINSPEARMYLSRQLFEEALHVQFYLTLLDTYLPDHADREKAFSAVDNIPSIKKKAEFAQKWIGSIDSIEKLNTKSDRQKFLLNLICFACCIEGLFFFGSFAYVYFLRSKGLFQGLATGTNWVFRDESGHMNFALSVIHKTLEEEPDLMDESLKQKIQEMMTEAVDCEYAFAQDVLELGVAGMSAKDMKSYLEFIADQRLLSLGLNKIFKSQNPFNFLELQNVQELTNFFERRVSSYQTGVHGEVSFEEEF
jgi:ribonucleoside-diphosphate reductase beta chain